MQRSNFPLFSVLLVISVLLVALGFNTLDVMMWSFYYEPWLEWFPYQWAMTPTLRFGVWEAYMVFGVLPLAVGMFLVGFLIGRRLK